MLVETRWSSSECNVVCGKNCLPSGGLRSASDGKGPQKKKNPEVLLLCWGVRRGCVRGQGVGLDEETSRVSEPFL